MNKPVPVVIAPLLVVCSERALAPISQVEAAAPVRLSAPALVSARIPEVVVLSVKLPDVELIVLVVPVRSMELPVPALLKRARATVVEALVADRSSTAALPLVTAAAVETVATGVVVAVDETDSTSAAFTSETVEPERVQ